MLRRRSECLDDADESGTEYFLSANTSMSSLYSSSSSESDFINFHVLNSSHFDQITMAVEELIDKRNDKTTTTQEETMDWADGFNEEEIDLIQNVARLVQDARDFWETVDDHDDDDEMYTLREREEALSQSYLELELVAAVTDVHVDWLVQQTLRLNEKYENQEEDDQTEEHEHKKDDDETKPKAKEKNECRRESIVCVHTTTKKMMMKHEYSIEQQIDDIPSHFSFQTGLGSENGSDRDRSPSVGPPINFSQAVLYDMPSAHQQLKNIANAYVLNKTQFGELEYDDDANDLSVWLDVICMEFEGFNRQFVRQVMSLHRRDVEKTVYALHELEMTRRVRNVRLHGGCGDKTGGGGGGKTGGDGCSVHWVPPRARRESTVYTSVGSTISRLSQM